MSEEVRVMGLLMLLVGAVLGGTFVWMYLDGKKRYEKGIRTIEEGQREREQYLGGSNQGPVKRG